MKTIQRFLTIAVLVSLTGSVAMCDVSLPAIFGSSMVLQQNSDVTVWGWAEPGEKVSVKGSWQWLWPTSTKADANGNWRVRIKTPRAGGPYTLTVKGKNKLVFKDILMGEVWVCSGQSNMEWVLGKLDGEDNRVAAETADFPNIRLFGVARKIALTPENNCTGQWKICTPENAKEFSAVAFYFGRRLHQDLNIPIGLINTSWGGTPAQSWASEEALRTHGGFDDLLDKLRKPEEHINDFPNAYTPSVLFNGMLYPLMPFRIAGAIWYQGEGNWTQGLQYRTLFPAMITDWRTHWQQGNFPFYYVQIAPWHYNNPDGAGSAVLREAQMLTLKAIPAVGMAVTMDIGDKESIHPINKVDVGNRLALWALAKDYHRDVVYSGPIYKDMKVEGNAIRLSFEYVGSGLAAHGGALTGFEIAGEDQKFVPAEAVIDGSTIVVRSEQVAQPAAVRYGFKNWAQPNLFNAEGLPASSFRTDDWPVTQQ